MKKTLFHSLPKSILLTGLIAGTLDILSAIFLLAHGHAAAVFRFIAKGALGNSAMEGGFEKVVIGAIFHYTIAYSFTIGYFLVFPYISFLKTQKIASGLLYGIYVWAFMHYLVLPLTYNPPAPATFSNSWEAILILMFAIGLPVSLLSHKYYSAVNQNP